LRNRGDRHYNSGMSDAPPPIPPSIPQSPVLPYAVPGMSAVPCPRCGSVAKKPVTFTWWGGLVGPKLFHHVKCLGCGYAYNGKTGKSNNKAIAIYTIVAFVVVIGLVIVFLYANA
jgi:hypothetical protein